MVFYQPLFTQYVTSRAIWWLVFVLLYQVVCWVDLELGSQFVEYIYLALNSNKAKLFNAEILTYKLHKSFSVFPLSFQIYDGQNYNNGQENNMHPFLSSSELLSEYLNFEHLAGFRGESLLFMTTEDYTSKSNLYEY